MKNTNLLESNKTSRIVPFANEKKKQFGGSRARGGRCFGRYLYKTTFNSKKSLTEQEYFLHSYRTLMWSLECIHMELYHMKSDFTQKVDNVKAAVVEIEKTIKFPSEN